MDDSYIVSDISHLPGDRVKVRSGDSKGMRALISAIDDQLIELRLESGDSLVISDEFITNYSLAARKAWKSMPKRAGRPRSDKRMKRMVSMRVDSEVWEQLGEAVNNGLIQSREQAINLWLRLHVEELFSLSEAILNKRNSGGTDGSKTDR